MKYTNILLTTTAVAFLATGCVKPTQDNSSVYNGNQQQSVYESAPIVYEDPAVTQSQSGVIYNQIPTDTTSYPQTTYPQTSYPETTTYPQTTTTYPAATNQPVYTNPYETTGTTTYPDPYANGSVTTSTTTNYPTPVTYPTTTTTSTQGAGGIHLQIAALKSYYAAEELKNTLSLAPGQSAYIQRGAMNKVIVTGISSVAEANQLKNSRFPGAFIVQGGNTGGYISPAPTYNTGTTYTVNDPYGVPSSTNNTSYSNVNGIGVQVGAFSSRAKAQEVANSQGGQYPAVVKKIGHYYKVILTGFSNRSAAKAYASQVGGFVVSAY